MGEILLASRKYHDNRFQKALNKLDKQLNASSFLFKISTKSIPGYADHKSVFKNLLSVKVVDQIGP